MNRLSSPAYQQAKAIVPGVVAHGATPEQLVAAEMYLASLAPSPQASLFNQQHANPGVATRGQPSPVGCVSALTRDPE
jgi:hypothetical protein